MYSIYGRKRNEGGYKRILESNDYFLKNNLPSSDLNTVKGDSPGVVSFIENNMRFIGVVIPHIYGTPSEKRSHCITHIIGEPTSSDDSVWKYFNKEILNLFYHGTEDDASSCADSLKPEIIRDKAAMIHHIEDNDLNFNQGQRLLRYLRFYPDTIYNVQCEKSVEYKLFKFLVDNLEEPIALNIESSCRININGCPRTPFFSTLIYNDIPPFELNYTFESEEFDIVKLRRTIYKIYDSFDKSEAAEALTFFETEKAKIPTKLIASDQVEYAYKKQVLGKILLFVAEKNSFVKPEPLFYDTPSLEYLYDFSTFVRVLKELPLSTYKKKQVIKSVKKLLSVTLY